MSQIPKVQTKLHRTLLSLLTALTLVGTPVFGEVTAPTQSYAATSGDDYPTQWRNIPMDSVYDSWGEFNRECTSAVAWWLHERNGFEMPFHANATDWKAKAQALGYTVNSTPAHGAVAWTSTHVAWTVSYTSTTVTVDEYDEYDSNHDGVYGDDGTYDQRTVPISSFQYIHFDDITDQPPSGDSDFQPFAGDFNGDGIGDIGLRKVSNGNFFIKHGPNFSDQVVYSWASGSEYQPFVGDFNGDGIADIGLRDVLNGNFFIKHGPSFSDQVVYSWSVATGTDFQPFAGDFNGDGIGDIGLRRISNGNLYIKHGPNFSDQQVYTWAPGTNYQPFVADFNGDGYADIGLRNVSNGNFFIKHGPSFSDQLVYAWSVASGTDFQPFAGDFNGDGLGDIGLRRISNGNFFIKHGTSFGDQVVYPWSSATG